jgi:hypothetical protein
MVPEFDAYHDYGLDWDLVVRTSLTQLHPRWFELADDAMRLTPVGFGNHFLLPPLRYPPTCFGTYSWTMQIIIDSVRHLLMQLFHDPIHENFLFPSV